MSPPRRSATLIPRADLPDAVGPRITMSRAPASGASPLIPETPSTAAGAPAAQDQPAAGPRRFARGSVSMEAGLFRTHVIEEGDSQFQIRAVKLRRQRLEGIRRMNGGHRCIVERFFTRRSLQRRIGRRNAAVRID